MAVTAADQAQFEAEYKKFLEQEQAAAARLNPRDAKAAAHEFVSSLRETGLRELNEFKEELQNEARQAAVNVLAESGLPPGAAAAVVEVGEAIATGRPVDADALARAAVAGVATAACATNPYTAAVAWACGMIAGALYSPIKNAFARAFGRKTQAEIDAQKKENAYKDEAAKYYWAAKTAHDRKLTALLAFVEEGLRLWGARVVGKGREAKLWYADPLIIKQDPFRTPVNGTGFQQKQLATQQLAFVNRFLKEVYSKDFGWMRDGDIELGEVLANGKYDFRRAELYIKPAWRVLMVGEPPPWVVALRGQELLNWAAAAKRVIEAERAKKGADPWPVCLDPATKAFPVMPGRMTTPPYAIVGGCANSLYACRIDGNDVQCMPTGYGRTLHPPGNNLDQLRFPYKAAPVPAWVSSTSGNNAAYNSENVPLPKSNGQQLLDNAMAKIKAAADNAAAITATKTEVRYGGANPVTRNMKAAAVQADQYQAVLSSGGDKLRFIAEEKARQLSAARVAGVAAEAKVQAAKSADAVAKTGAALTAEQKARADAESRAAASSTQLRYLLAALAAAGAWYWYSTSKRKSRKAR